MNKLFKSHMAGWVQVREKWGMTEERGREVHGRRYYSSECGGSRVAYV